MHFVASDLFGTKHSEHSHVSLAGANLLPQEFVIGIEAGLLRSPDFVISFELGPLLVSNGLFNMALNDEAAFVVFAGIDDG